MLAWVALVLNVGAVAQTPIPIETLFRRPDYSATRLSPVGGQLAAIVPGLVRSKLAVVDLKAMRATPAAVADDADVVSFAWISDRRLAVDVGDLSDASGRPCRRGAIAVDADGRNVVRTWVVSSSILYRFPGTDEVLVFGHRPGESTDVWRVDTRVRDHGAMLTFDNPGRVFRWVVDHSGNVRAAVAYDREHRQLVVQYRAGPDAKWKEISRFSSEGNDRRVPLVHGSRMRDALQKN